MTICFLVIQSSDHAGRTHFTPVYEVFNIDIITTRQVAAHAWRPVNTNRPHRSDKAKTPLTSICRGFDAVQQVVQVRNKSKAHSRCTTFWRVKKLYN